MKLPSAWLPRRALLAIAISLPAAFAPAQRVTFEDGFPIADLDAVDGNGAPRADASPEDVTGPHVIEFADGHTLHGTLAGLDGERRELRWQRADSSAPFTFPLPEISRLLFGAGAEKKQAQARTTGGATVKLAGGDWLVGDRFAMVDGGGIGFSISGGPQTSVPRAQVDWIYFHGNGPAPECYDGPTGLAGFNTFGGWEFRDGALRALAPTQLARTFAALPDQVEYLVDMSQVGAVNSFRIAIAPSSSRGVNLRPVQLRISGEQMQFWAPVGGNFKVEQIDISELLHTPAAVAGGGMKLDRSRKLELRLLHDFSGGRFYVFINGKRAGEWAIDKGPAGENSGTLSFQPMAWDANAEQSISRLRVMPWDGRTEADEDADSDRVVLATSEVKRGTLTGLDAAKISINTAEGPLTFPLEAIRLLRLRSQPQADAPAAATLARVRLRGGGELDATRLIVSESGVRLGTRWGAEADFAAPLAAVREITFEGARWSELGATDVLLFKNGDQLHGQMESAALGESVAWRAAAGDPAFRIRSEGLLGVRTASHSVAEEEAAPSKASTVARFKNGDRLTGSLVSLDPAQLVLQTAEADRVTISRDQLHTLYFSPDGNPPVLDGATGPEDWTSGVRPTGTVFTSNRIIVNGAIMGGTQISGATGASSPRNAWRAFDGAFSITRPAATTSSGSVINTPPLSRTMEAMPQVVEIAFDIRSPAQPVAFASQLFFEPTTPGFMLQVHAQGLYLHDLSPRRGAGGFPQQVQFDAKVQNDAHARRIRLLADRPAGKLTVVIDGVVMAHAVRKPGDGLRNLGRGFTLTPQVAPPCTVSNLWIGPWDGREPGKAPPSPEAEAAPHSLVLVNGDEARGTVESATPDAVKLLSEIGEIEVPAARLTMVQFTGAEVVPRSAPRLRLKSGGALTVSSYRVDGDSVRCHSELAGDLSLPLAGVSEIVFGPAPKPARAP